MVRWAYAYLQDCHCITNWKKVAWKVHTGVTENPLKDRIDQLGNNKEILDANHTITDRKLSQPFNTVSPANYKCLWSIIRAKYHVPNTGQFIDRQWERVYLTPCCGMFVTYFAPACILLCRFFASFVYACLFWEITVHPLCNSRLPHQLFRFYVRPSFIMCFLPYFYRILMVVSGIRTELCLQSDR